MTGTAVADTGRTVITQTTQAVLLMSRKPRLQTTGCIRCGWCISGCPVGIDPIAILDALEADPPRVPAHAGGRSVHRLRRLQRHLPVAPAAGPGRPHRQDAVRPAVICQVSRAETGRSSDPQVNVVPCRVPRDECRAASAGGPPCLRLHRREAWHSGSRASTDSTLVTPSPEPGCAAETGIASPLADFLGLSAGIHSGVPRAFFLEARESHPCNSTCRSA